MTPDAAPGWYPDPRGGDGHRYWTGESWAPDGAAQAPQPPVDPWAPAGAAPMQSYGTNVLSSHGADYGQPYSPLMPGSGRPPSSSRRAATWLALIAGVVGGFGAGYAVADARQSDTERARPVITAPSPTPRTTRVPSPLASPSRPNRGTQPQEPSENAEQTPDESSPAPMPQDPDAALLDRIGLRRGDVAPAVGLGLIGGGDQVAGQTTLDLCKAVFPSESRRTARRQLAAVTSDDAFVMMTEAVLYDSADALDAAFAELEGAATTSGCELEATVDKGWPQTDGVRRLAYSQNLGTGAGAFHSTAVYLRSGRTLLALYFRDPGVTATAVAGKRTIKDVTAVFADRLAALPTSASTT